MTRTKTPPNHKKPSRRKNTDVSVAGVLMPLVGRDMQMELEAFRIEWEKANGATDLTRRYTSTWPPAEQDSLFARFPEKYFDGLPPFAKAWIIAKVDSLAACGRLDDVPQQFLQLLIQGHLRRENSHR